MLAAAPDAPAQPPEAAAAQPIIRDIAFHGLEHVSPELAAQIAQAVLHALVGKTYDDKLVQNAVIALRNTGWYADVASATVPMEGGVRLLFTVKENPIVLQEAVTGFEHLTAQQRQLVLDAAQTLQNLPVNNNAETLGAQKLRDLGWFRQCTCTRADVPGGVRLNFSVMELPVIAGIAFVGHTRFTEQQLWRQIAMRPGLVLNRNTVRDDAQAIEAMYAKQGFTQTRVQDYHLSDDNTLVFVIMEPTIKRVVIAGNTTTTEATIRNALTFHVGDIYNIDAISESLKKLDALALFKDITSIPEPDPTPDKLLVTVHVQEREHNP